MIQGNCCRVKKNEQGDSISVLHFLLDRPPNSEANTKFDEEILQHFSFKCVSTTSILKISVLIDEHQGEILESHQFYI